LLCGLFYLEGDLWKWKELGKVATLSANAVTTRYVQLMMLSTGICQWLRQLAGNMLRAPSCVRAM
jgi:hypothetical protein